MGNIKEEKKKLFLETTSQIARLLGLNKKRRKVHEIIGNVLNCDNDNNKLFTSEIVYCEFLNTLVKDVLIIRNLIFNEFLQKKIFILNLSEIDDHIFDSKDYNIKFRSKRLFGVTSALKRRFPKSDTIETKRVINFLNSFARDLAIRDFFNIRIDEKNRVKINKNSPNYLNEISCLSELPFQEGFQMDNNGKYFLQNYQNLKDENGNNICISNETTTAKCDKNPIEDCGIEDFFKKEGISQKLKKLIDESKKGLMDESKKQKPFSSKFRNKDKNKKWIELMQDSILDDFITEFKYRGKECHRYFFDMLIALQCPEDARILSNDKDYDELGKVIGRSDLLLNFDKSSQENN